MHEIDRLGNLVESKITGVSARFITFAQAGVPEPPTPVPGLTFWGILLLLPIIIFCTLTRRRLLN